MEIDYTRTSERRYEALAHSAKCRVIHIAVISNQAQHANLALINCDFVQCGRISRSRLAAHFFLIQRGAIHLPIRIDNSPRFGSHVG